MRALLSTTRCDWDTSAVVAEVTGAALSISLLSAIGSSQRQRDKNPILLPFPLQLWFHGVVKVRRGGQQPLWVHKQDGTGSAGPIQPREPPGAPLTVTLGVGGNGRKLPSLSEDERSSLSKLQLCSKCAQ